MSPMHDTSMKHGNDPPCENMGHKTPNNKNTSSFKKAHLFPRYNVALASDLSDLKMCQGIFIVHPSSNVHL